MAYHRFTPYDSNKVRFVRYFRQPRPKKGAKPDFPRDVMFVKNCFDCPHCPLSCNRVGLASHEHGQCPKQDGGEFFFVFLFALYFIL